MNTTDQPTETERIASARESFSGRLRSEPQFNEAIAVVKIIHPHIEVTGTFTDKLGDYAHAYARNLRMKPQQAETMIRDLYREVYGQTMNQTRETLMTREEALTDADRAQGYEHAVRIGERVERGDKIAFSRAYAAEAQAMAGDLGITHVAARKIMGEEFEAAEGMKLSDWGKELDQQFFQPQIEAEKEQRARNRGQTRTGSNGNSDQHAAADAGWDHAQDVADAGERPTRSTVPRAGSRPNGRVTRTPSGPTRSGP